MKVSNAIQGKSEEELWEAISLHAGKPAEELKGLLVDVAYWSPSSAPIS